MGICAKCGRYFSVTKQTAFCPECERSNMSQASNCDIPIPHGFGEQKGWICPVCGRGLAPWVDVCPCHKYSSEVNITTTTNPEDIKVDLIKYYTLINDGSVPEANFENADLLER